MTDSRKSNFWTLERAQGAIKGAFFAREVVSPETAEDPKLHFSEIRGLIGKNERPIGDRTLSRAISALTARGHLKKNGTGRATVYTLDVPRSERLKAFARADATWLEQSAALGGIADIERGYAVYGVPDLFRERYRSRLRREALQYQVKVRELLAEVWDESAASLLKPTRRRIPLKTWREGEKAVYRINRRLVAGGLGQGYSVRFWKAKEGTVPSAVLTFQKALEVNFTAETPIEARIGTVVSKLSGADPGVVQSAVDQELKRMARDASRLVPLWDALTPKERARARGRVAAAMALTTGLTSVVHA